MTNFVVQIVSVAGASLVLGAFFALQTGRTTSHARLYLWCNFVGAGLLVLVASVDRRLGFILLEGAWAAVALYSIVRGRRSPVGRAESTRL